jgi:hypothetical protein
MLLASNFGLVQQESAFASVSFFAFALPAQLLHVYLHIHIYVYIYIYIYIPSKSSTSARSYIYINTYIHTHTHTNTCMNYKGKEGKKNPPHIERQKKFTSTKNKYIPHISSANKYDPTPPQKINRNIQPVNKN